MGSIYRRQRDGKPQKKWTIVYTDEKGVRRVVPGFSDKKATQEKLRQLEVRAERLRVGLPVEDDVQLTTSAEKAIDAYVADMQRRGLADVHWKESRRQLHTLRSECHWKTLADVRTDGLTAFLAKLQAAGRSSRTLNGYRDHLATFCAWCIAQGWMTANPAARVPKSRSKGRKVKPRRAYTVAEFHAILQATRSHRLLYLVAGLSGLRRLEIRKLEKRDLTPTGDKPTWHLRAEITKGKRRDVVPILAELVPELLAHWKSLPSPTSRLFPRIPRTQTHHKDLRRAKVRRLDDEGRCLDFHSFRLFFCTLLARRLPIQTVRLLMRHRDIHQTCNVYMDLGLTDVREEMLQLPALLEIGAAATAAGK